MSSNIQLDKLVVMRLKCLFICVVSLCMFVLAQKASANSSNGTCDLPLGLRDEISGKYPQMHIVSLADLNADDRKLFQKDHDDRCPGLVEVNFYGGGKPTWALAITAVEGQKTTTKLLVARQLSTRWETAELETTDGPPPAIWKQAPGKYRDVYGEKTIRATHQVIVFCGYNSWAILYSWSGAEVRKIWLKD
jgi:hypothetical protein